MTSNIVIQKDKIISVGELNKSAKYLLEHNFNNVSVIGEISNLSKPSSGHVYFTLKDKDGAIKCAMFKSVNIRQNFTPQNGDQCIIKGQVSLYTIRGDFQLIVKAIEPSGIGNLTHEFEKLKKKLKNQGLFDSNQKLVIPQNPKHVGVITSPSTAAFQDIISTVMRRAPSTQISLSEAVVQGENAHISIIKALERIITFNNANKENKIDVVILSRGGGSIEDLWCFNNEDLAISIYNYPIPIISGVGHEIDFTICDFVADLRVPTPTASAEMITEFKFNLKEYFDELQNNIFRKINKKIDNLNQKIILNKTKLKNPLLLIREKIQILDSFDLRIQQQQKMILSNNKNRINNICLKMNNNNPASKLKYTRDEISTLNNKLNRGIKEKILAKENYLKKLLKNIEILSPFSILDRGYSIITNNDGIAIKSKKEVDKGQQLSARLKDGSIKIEVK
ncbi:MAG: exodeoxyribonuclease VII large subunit [Gammaproteobacteria bacterium]|nr:exodeoxyribonuclease VII large subunit [Gammaproteobacteria bacterium]